jgi:hypothetical protein
LSAAALPSLKVRSFTSGEEHNCRGEPITDEGYNVSSDSSCNFNRTGSFE